MSVWSQWTRMQLSQIEAAGQWRRTETFDGSVHAFVGGRPLINFASNDYLGLSQHPRVREAAGAAIAASGTGTGSARLVTGTKSQHVELEQTLASWQGCERALVFPTGYAANLGVMTTFGEGTTIFSDALNHASIIDGCRLARGRTIVFEHNDVDRLAALMNTVSGRKLIVTERIFSMDGDAAPIRELSRLCTQHDALLIVDEAHAVLGPTPVDLDCEHIVVGTLSKTFGSLGGWVAGTKAAIDLLVNRARSFVFTTALTPADAAAALAALRIYRSEEGAALRERLRRHVDALRMDHPSPIVPIVLGSEASAINASRHLLEQGFYVPAIRPPTVPPGTARLRITLSAAHREEEVASLRHALVACNS